MSNGPEFTSMQRNADISRWYLAIRSNVGDALIEGVLAAIAKTISTKHPDLTEKEQIQMEDKLRKHVGQSIASRPGLLYAAKKERERVKEVPQISTWGS